ncbi:putative galacturonosyltransferase-like 2, partial [Ananas comosus]
MASSPAALLLLLLLLLLLVFFFSPSSGEEGNGGGVLPRFAEAPQFRDGEGARGGGGRGGAGGARARGAGAHRDDAGRALPPGIHGRDLLAAEARIVPRLPLLHLVASDPAPERLRSAVAASFPSLRFGVYPFPASLVRGSSPPRPRALESPLNYARSYLADLLPACVPRAIYLDSDVLAVDDVRRLWATRLPSAAVVAAPEYCRANFTATSPRLLVRLRLGPALPPPPPPPPLLLQHRRHARRPPPLARRRLPPQDRGVDGPAAAAEDLRAGVSAAFFWCFAGAIEARRSQ